MRRMGCMSLPLLLSSPLGFNNHVSLRRPPPSRQPDSPPIDERRNEPHPQSLKDWKIEALKDWKIERLKDWKIERLKEWKIENFHSRKVFKADVLWQSFNLSIFHSFNLSMLQSFNLSKIEALPRVWAYSVFMKDWKIEALKDWEIESLKDWKIERLNIGKIYIYIHISVRVLRYPVHVELSQNFQLYWGGCRPRAQAPGPGPRPWPTCMDMHGYWLVGHRSPSAGT